MMLKLDAQSIRQQGKGGVSQENLVKDAVEFLSNEKVKATSLRRRILFLKAKGLNTDQICNAFARSGQPIERQRVADTEPDIAITSIRASVPDAPIESKWSIRHYLALAGLSFFSAIGASHLLQRLIPYEIHIQRKGATQVDHAEKVQSDAGNSAKLRTDLAKLHGDLARSRAETRRHLLQVDKLLLDRQQLESEIDTLRQAGGGEESLEGHVEEEEEEEELSEEETQEMTDM
ncbi:peroxisomal membrane protein PEX14 [Perkinsela sp. CCAP 1560/4]|nr:peroxisomal membrane protein PEX14 [Perkinsela sp. CCAP 1560/4]|eukprot:KNH05746.1 peroxisomal membrane protein PEX14 [Perkinsela sp. CCAP 1560/4]